MRGNAASMGVPPEAGGPVNRPGERFGLIRSFNPQKYLEPPPLANPKNPGFLAKETGYRGRESRGSG